MAIIYLENLLCIKDKQQSTKATPIPKTIKKPALRMTKNKAEIGEPESRGVSKKGRKKEREIR